MNYIQVFVVGGELNTVIVNIKRFLEKNVDTIVILQVISFYTNSNELELIKEQFKEYKCRFKLSWLDTWANKFPDLAKMSPNICPNNKINRKPCSDLWYKASIHWDGRVSICCHDWDSKTIVGDLNKKSMIEIWNSKILDSYRTIHKNSEFEKIDLCRECFEWATIEEYDEYLLDK